MKKRGKLEKKELKISRPKSKQVKVKNKPLVKPKPLKKKIEKKKQKPNIIKKRKKGWRGEKEKHTVVARGVKISEYKRRKKTFTFIFVLGFLLNLVSLLKPGFFVFNLIGLPLILFSFFGYHYLTKLKEIREFKKKRKFIDYVNLFLFLVFFFFGVVFFLLKIGF